VKETAATNKAEETSKTESVETDLTPSLDDPSKVADESSIDASKQISPTEIECLVGSTFMDENAIWGDRVKWSQLKSHSTEDETNADMPFDHSWTVRETKQPDATANWLSNSQQDRRIAGKAYHEAARQLDAIASDLEDARLYSDADAVRTMTQKLRVRARMLPWDEREENERVIFFGGSLAR
jgi:hypothetical protein